MLYVSLERKRGVKNSYRVIVRRLVKGKRILVDVLGYLEHNILVNKYSFLVLKKKALANWVSQGAKISEKLMKYL